MLNSVLAQKPQNTSAVGWQVSLCFSLRNPQTLSKSSDFKSAIKHFKIHKAILYI